MKRLLPFLGCVLTATLACGGSGSTPGPAASPDQPITVHVAHAPSTLFAPLYLAIDRGYFAKQKVTVELDTIKAGQDAIALAANGQIDVVVAGFSAGLFNGLNRGLEFKVVGSMGASPKDGTAPSALEVSKQLFDSGAVKSPADLRGRKIALSGGNTAAGAFQADTVLQQAGLGLKDVTVVNLGFPDMEAAIRSGAVAAALPPAPFTTRMEADGVAVKLGQPPVGTTATGVIYGKTFLKNRDAAQRFFNGLARAAQDLQGDQKKSPETLATLAKYTGQTVEVLQKVPFYDWFPRLAPDVKSLDRMQATYRSLGLLDYPTNLKTSAYVDDSFSRKAP